MKQHYNIKWLTNRFENGDSLKFLYFWGHTKNNDQEVGNFCLSQWFESPFTINGLTYKTSEHWMMAQKALLFDNQEIFRRIIECDKPNEAKELGRQIIGFDEIVWKNNRFNIVCLGNIHKFNQNQAMGEYLLKTGNKILVESSPVDTIWGIGLTKESEDIHNIYTWSGLNLLGFVLMEVRDFLNEFGFFSNLDNDLIAPWIKYPKIDLEDLFWRMGKGEEFVIKFSNAFDKLTDREKTIYKLTNPEPYRWKGFYE